MAQGTVKRFNSEKSFGFIAAEGSGQRVRGTNWTNLDFAGVLRRFACEPSGKVQPVAAPSASRDHCLEGNRADQPPDSTQQP